MDVFIGKIFFCRVFFFLGVKMGINRLLGKYDKYLGVFYYGIVFYRGGVVIYFVLCYRLDGYLVWE